MIKRLRNILYLVSFFCLCSFNSAAQAGLTKLKFSRLGVNEGLSHSNVTCILQDTKGYLWVGTEDGLNKYDGYDFTIYRNIKTDSTSLLKNCINALLEDNRGIIWISTRGGGLHHYDHVTGRIRRVNPFGQHFEVVTIIEDHQQNIWIAGTMGGHAFVATQDQTTQQWNHFNLFPSNEAVCFMVPESENEFWVGVRRTGIFRWNFKTGSLKNFSQKNNDPAFVVSKDVVKAVKDDYGDIWIATREGLSKLDLRTEQFTHLTANPRNPNSLPVNVIRDLCLDNNYLWIATENGGLSRFDWKHKRFKNFSFDKNDPDAPSDNSIWSVYKDHQGRIWAGTFSRGLCVLDPFMEKFSELDVPLENDIVNAIWQDDKNRIWIGTEGGLVMKDKDKVHHYKHDDTQGGSLSSDPVLSIYEDSRNRIWIGTWEGGLNRYNEEQDNFIHYLPRKDDPESISDTHVYAIGEHRATGRLLVSSYKGLNVLVDEKKGTFVRYVDGYSESNNYLRTIYQDNQGNVWIGSISELNLLNVEGGHRDRYYFNDSTSFDGFVNSILEDKKGRLWIGTNTGLHMMVDRKIVASYTHDDGLPNDIVNGILEDRKGNLWLSTAQGLSMFDPDAKKFKNFNTSDGLESNEFKPGACYKSDDGRMFFGGKGVTVFYPDSIRNNPYIPPVAITGLKLFNNSVSAGGADQILVRPISETREISLEHQQNFFSIHYVALNFTASRKNQYAYKLEGFDQDWNYVGGQRSATFTNLDAGTYKFRVKASNNDGVWNEQGALLVIHVLPPWWDLWWFKATVMLLVLMSFIFYYKTRVNRIRKRNRILEKLVAKRTEALQRMNAELMSSGREIKAQNYELRKARKIIEEQNKKIKLRNETLTRDVKKRTRELVEYTQQLEQFAFMSAHNLRAPVARILGLGQVLELTQDDPEQTRMIFDKLVLTTHELDAVVRDLISILELKRNNTAMIHEVNLTEELKLIKMNLQTQIRETKTSIREDFSEAETLQVVRPYLDSILIHLISNAIKFRHPLRKPIIRIKTEVMGKYICLSVKDNGLGIDLSLYKNHLFALYHRFHSHVEGKGIGLFLVKTQVIALRGRIEVKSEVDKGTTFRIYLRSDKLLEAKKNPTEETVPVQQTVKWFNRFRPK